jgi:hypothetical protein
MMTAIGRMTTMVAIGTVRTVESMKAMMKIWAE